MYVHNLTTWPDAKPLSEKDYVLAIYKSLARHTITHTWLLFLIIMVVCGLMNSRKHRTLLNVLFFPFWFLYSHVSDFHNYPCTVQIGNQGWSLIPPTSLYLTSSSMTPILSALGILLKCSPFSTTLVQSSIFLIRTLATASWPVSLLQVAIPPTHFLYQNEYNCIFLQWLPPNFK